MNKLKKVLGLGLVLLGLVCIPNVSKAEIARDAGLIDQNPYNTSSGFENGHAGEGLVSSYGAPYRIGVTTAKDLAGNHGTIVPDAGEDTLNAFMSNRYVPVDDQYFHIYVLSRNPQGYAKINEGGAQWYFVQNAKGSGEYRYPQTHATTKSNTAYFIGASSAGAGTVDGYLNAFRMYTGGNASNFIATAMKANNSKPTSDTGQSMYDWLVSAGMLNHDSAYNTLSYLLCAPNSGSLKTWTGAKALNKIQSFENAEIHWCESQGSDFDRFINIVWYNACMAYLGSEGGKDVSPYIDNITRTILSDATGYAYVTTVESVQCVARSKQVSDGTGWDGASNHYLGKTFGGPYSSAEMGSNQAIYSSYVAIMFNCTHAFVGYAGQSYRADVNQSLSDQVAAARQYYCDQNPGCTLNQLLGAVPEPNFPLYAVGDNVQNLCFQSGAMSNEFLWKPWYGSGNNTTAYFMTLPQYMGICINYDITSAVYLPNFWTGDVVNYNNTMWLMQDATNFSISELAKNMGYWDPAGYVFLNSPLAQLFVFNTGNAYWNINMWISDRGAAWAGSRDDWVNLAHAGWNGGGVNAAPAKYWGKHLLTEFIPGARVLFDNNGFVYFATSQQCYNKDVLDDHHAWSVCTKNDSSAGFPLQGKYTSAYNSLPKQFGFCCFSPLMPTAPTPPISGTASFDLKSLTKGPSAISGDTWDELDKEYGYISDDVFSIDNKLTNIKLTVDDNVIQALQAKKDSGKSECLMWVKIEFVKAVTDDYSNYSYQMHSINLADKYRGNWTAQYKTTLSNGNTYVAQDGVAFLVNFEDFKLMVGGATWEIVNCDTLDGKISAGEHIVEGYALKASMKEYDSTGDFIQLSDGSSWKLMSATRKQQYFHVSTKGHPIIAYAETKDGGKDVTESGNASPGNERYEAMSGVPSTEKMYYTFGGTSYIADVLYTIVQNATLDGHEHCSYLKILSYDVWALDKGSVDGNGLGGFAEVGSVEAQIPSGKLNIKFIPAHVEGGGSGYNIVGDQLLYINEHGQWANMVGSSYSVSSDYFNGNHYDDYRNESSEGSLGAMSSNVFGDTSEPATNEKTSPDHPCERPVQEGFFKVVGYNGKGASLNQPSEWNNKFTYVIPSTSYNNKITTNNGLYGDITSHIYYKKLHGDDSTNFSKKTKYTPSSQYSVNPVLIHDPIKVDTEIMCGDDYTISYNHNFNRSNPAETEPYDQRVKHTNNNLVRYTTPNNLFIEYDFAVSLTYVGDFSNDNPDNYGLAEPTTARGLGLNHTAINTTRWIQEIVIKFPVPVLYQGTFYEAGQWIELSVDPARATGKYIYDNFYMPLIATEIDQGQIEVRVTAINAEGGKNPNKIDIINKERNPEYIANHVVDKKDTIDVVGHIGGMEMVDTGDYRFSNLFKKTTSGWLIDNLVKNVDPSKQNYLLVDPVDTLRKSETLNAFGTQPYRAESSLITLPLTPSQNTISQLKKQPLRLGYSQFMSLETIGNYYGDTRNYNGEDKGSALKNKEVEIRPHYYFVDTKTNKAIDVDIYAPINGEYEQIFDADSTTNPDLYEWFHKIDWENENVRRMYVSEEEDATSAGITLNNAKEISAIQKDTINLGTVNELFLRATCRTYMGYNDAERQAQRWHFTLGIPSGSVFVKSGEKEVSDKTKLSGGYILTTLEVISKGEVWDLYYNNAMTVNTDIASGIPKLPWTTGNPPWDTFNEIPISITSVDKSASDDLDIKGTH